MIEARDLVVRSRGGTRLLDGVSLALRPGTVTAILGPNGAGKTTLLRVLAGLLHPDSGSVTLDGAPLTSLGRVALARRRAVLGQHQTLEFALPVSDVVALGRMAHAGTPAARDDRAAIAAVRAEFGLEPLWHRATPSLSGGERQRVHLARVAVQLWAGPAGSRAGTRALFLDEPTAALDVSQQHLALNMACGLAARGIVVAEILHDLNQAATADQVVLLRAGIVVAAGRPERVLNPDTLRLCFGVAVEVLHRADGRPAFVTG